MRGLLLAALLGLLVRLAVIALVPSLHFANDPADYLRLGAALAHGGNFGTSHLAPAGGPTALRPPLFPMALASGFWVFGNHIIPLRIGQALLGAVTVLLVGLLGRRLFGPRVGTVGAVLAAVCPSLVLASTSFMSESLFLPLLLASVLTALVARDTSRAWPWVVGCGVLLALAGLTRPIGLLVLLPCLVLIGLRRSGVLVLVSLVVLLPWEVRTARLLHAVPPLTTQGGFLLAGTYNATADHDAQHPAQWRPYVVDPDLVAAVRAHPDAGEAETEQVLRDGAVSYAADHPGYPFRVVYWNLRRMLLLVPLSETRATIRGEYGYGGAAALAEALGLVALVACGVWGVVRRRTRDLLGSAPWAVWATPLLLVLATAPVQGFPRFRAPADPFLILMAAVALAGRVTPAEGSLSQVSRR